jgi:ABC-type Zn uptake system ZnuABC Zn-binding protein ZnuA
VALAQATVIFETGAGFEPWLDDVYEASDSRAARVVVTDGLELIEPAEAEGDEPIGATPDAGHDHAYAHGAVDPHVWHSVAQVIQMVKTIRDGLTQVDSTNAGRYQTNAEAYIQQLQALDTWVFEQVRALPPERRVLVTNHDTFAYFAARYGFEVLGTLLPGSTEGASPSAHEVAELAEKIKAAGVPAVFTENVATDRLLAQVANEAGIDVVAVLYTDALGPAGSEGDTYIKLMRFNVTTLVKALGQ